MALHQTLGRCHNVEQSLERMRAWSAWSLMEPARGRPRDAATDPHLLWQAQKGRLPVAMRILQGRRGGRVVQYGLPVSTPMVDHCAQSDLLIGDSGDRAVVQGRDGAVAGPMAMVSADRSTRRCISNNGLMLKRGAELREGVLTIGFVLSRLEGAGQTSSAGGSF